MIVALVAFDLFGFCKRNGRFSASGVALTVFPIVVAIFLASFVVEPGRFSGVI